MRSAPRPFTGLLVALLALASLARAQERPATTAGGEFEWRFTIKANQTATSSISAQNICRQRHQFEIMTGDLPAFMRLLGEPGFPVQPHSEHSVPVQFDGTGLSPGLHEGKVIIKCLTCRAEKGCSQDFQRLHIYMTVEAQAAAPILVPGRVLVTIPLDSAKSAQATAGKLGAIYGMKVEEVSELRSLNVALIAYTLPEGADVLSKIAELASHSLASQPDFLYSTLEPVMPTREAGPQLSSASAQLQYGRRLIRADRLRGSVTGQGVTVALIDTGVDAGHPALQGRIATQTDVTDKGFTADVHATLLAGIIAGDAENGGGIAGVAPGVKILAIKACHPLSPQAVPAQCWSMTLAKGLDFAIENKAAVINMSLGGPGGVADPLLKRMVDEATGRGIVVVAAAGNDGPQGKPGFPAALPNVVAVTAVDSKEQLYASATQGDFIDLAAPGVEILSTSPGGKFLVSSGTSLAAAFVTATAALILQEQPRLAPKALQTLLENTAKDLGPPGKDPQFGSGLVDACRAVAELTGNRNLCH
jgi:subtilisin family serine protease